MEGGGGGGGGRMGRPSLSPPNNVEVPIILLDWKLDSHFGIGLS